MGLMYPFCKMKSFGDWLHDDMNTCNNTELHVLLEMVKMVSFIFFNHNKKLTRKKENAASHSYVVGKASSVLIDFSGNGGYPSVH